MAEMRLCSTALLLVMCISLCYTWGNVRMKPRLTQINPGNWSFPLPIEQPHAVFYRDSSDSLYIGGEEVLYHYDFKTMKTFSMKAEKYTEQCKEKPYCKNFVTLITQLHGSIVICGTNAYNPGCWTKDGDNFTKTSQKWAEQLSPSQPGCKNSYAVLNTGNETYSTIPRQSNNGASVKKTIFRKINGKDPKLYTSGSLLNNPKFVKSLVVDGMDSQIFLFFMDDNSENRTTDKRVPMIARMCKEEKGSQNPDERYMFSTALKSRLICGNPKDGQYYNFLEDIYFLKSQNLIYGLFTNAWNHSAVCAYKTEEIENVFNNSGLLQSEKKDLKIRPGTCLSTYTPKETADEAVNHPELNDWVLPSENVTIFQTLEYYRKLVVDEITGRDTKTYKVFILATDRGTLNKVVELDDGALNVLEMHPFNKTSEIMYLDLVSSDTQRILYVGTAHEVSRLYLDDCTTYNPDCKDCITSKDPYCDFYGGKCQSVLHISTVLTGGLASAMSFSGERLMSLAQRANVPQALCRERSEILEQRGSRYTRVKRIQNENNAQQLPSVYLLTCLAKSNQATYWWEYGENNREICTPQDGKCYMFLDDTKDPGEYHCMEEEFSQQRSVATYRYTAHNSSSRTRYGWLGVLVIPVCIILYSHMTHSATS